ncbi:glycosyltransferase [Paenibacillus albiflavus]|uniref:Glycosyltransferase n=1 Tax=Paenibacillus albiflavus TaxID=2545760 RepID=A0A4R4E2R7_9BACL|nr:glycosyltransferase family 2 protein [Paenibacillus albiflavus]TCZ73197.1 glycosyltransferase [Paenibacillus albiflavus]
MKPYTNAKQPKVSVIIPIFNERKTIASVIIEAYNVHKHVEVIVVSNGTTDGSLQIARNMGAKVIAFDHLLGHDVGRSIGARAAQGSILLFTDGDIVIPAKQMKPLIAAVEQGVDVALNGYSGPVKCKKVHKVVLAKHSLNYLLMRPDLKGASMTAIPHALSRNAVEAIGFEALSVPPKAQAIAIQKGLRVKALKVINVGSKNPLRRKTRPNDPIGKMIVGDHIEAIHWVLTHSAN